MIFYSHPTRDRDCRTSRLLGIMLNSITVKVPYPQIYNHGRINYTCFIITIPLIFTVSNTRLYYLYMVKREQ